MNEMSLFKTAVVKWTYDLLNKEFPDYFNSNPYTNIDGIIVNNSPNVYWANSVTDRPIDATECYLAIVSDESHSMGTDGEFYQDTTDNKWYYKLEEPHEITVNFVVSSMKNKALGLNALKAQNLSYNACSYIRMILKSGSASDYFCYENDYLKPILVCSQNRNISNIIPSSDFEETRDKFTYQFSCKFQYTQISKREVDLAQGAHLEIDYGGIEKATHDISLI